MNEFFNDAAPKRVISPLTQTGDAAIVGQIVDRAGFGESVYVITTGTIVTAGGAFAVTMDHGDAANLSDAVAVPAAQLQGTLALAGFTGADDDKNFKVGYYGVKRYHRLTITPTGNVGAALLSAVCVLSHAALQPTPNPPV